MKKHLTQIVIQFCQKILKMQILTLLNKECSTVQYQKNTYLCIKSKFIGRNNLNKLMMKIRVHNQI